MMKIYDLISSLQTAVAQDSELADMAVNWYGQAHRAFIDQDADNPPGEPDCPNLQFHSPEKRAAEDSRTVIYGFYLDIQVCDEADRMRAQENAFEFSATMRLAEFVERGLAVIRAAKPDDFSMSYEFVTDTITHFPVFTADVFVQFTQALVIGQDPLD
jgi:hypothetical protein